MESTGSASGVNCAAAVRRRRRRQRHQWCLRRQAILLALAAPAAPVVPVAAVPGASAGPAAAAVQEPHEGEHPKLPEDPHNFFEKVLLPKLQVGRPLDLSGSLADWVQVRTEGIRAGMQAPNYDDLRVDVKTITAAYDSLSIYCVASYRPKEGVRLMLKVKGPDGNISQAVSHAFPLPETGLCPKHAHLYLDMLHRLARACQHGKADLDQVRAWHDEVKMHLDFLMS